MLCFVMWKGMFIFLSVVKMRLSTTKYRQIENAQIIVLHRFPVHSIKIILTLTQNQTQLYSRSQCFIVIFTRIVGLKIPNSPNWTLSIVYFLRQLINQTTDYQIHYFTMNTTKLAHLAAYQCKIRFTGTKQSCYILLCPSFIILTKSVVICFQISIFDPLDTAHLALHTGRQWVTKKIRN